MTIILGWYPEGSSGAKRDEVLATHSATIPCSTSPSPQPQSIVKTEPSTPPPILQILHSPDVEPEPLPSYGWKHPAELQYFTPEDWLPTKLIFYLIANAFSVPPRTAVRGTPFFLLTRMNGETVTLPVGYRIPLLFLARFQWLSLKLVLTASSRETEWNEYKFSILHVSRLCTALLDAAQEYVRVSSEEGISKGMDRKWRCATFDRALARYRLKWFISGPEQVEEFNQTVGEDEYSKDAVKFDWRRWAIKGHRGFTLTDDEITIGITAEQFLVGLKQKNVDWYWDTEDHPIFNGIDAWSLRALASSVSPSASELPSTYSQTPPGSKPVEPVTVTTTAVELVPTGNIPSSARSLAHTASDFKLTNSVVSSSGSGPSSSQEHKNVSNSNFVPVPNSNGPAGNSRPSHSTNKQIPSHQPTSSAPIKTNSSQKNTSRKRPGSPLEKEMKTASKRVSSKDKTPSSTSTLANGKRAKGASGEKLSQCGSNSINGENGNYNSPSSCPPDSIKTLIPSTAPNKSNNMIVDEPSPRVSIPRISGHQGSHQNGTTNGGVGNTSENAVPAPPPPSSPACSSAQNVFLPPTPITASSSSSLSYPLPGPSGYPFVPYSSLLTHSSASPPIPVLIPTPTQIPLASDAPLPPDTTLPSNALLASENLSSSTVIQIIDLIFSSFADSLSRFSDEIKQTKAESVAEIKEHLTSTLLADGNKSESTWVRDPGLEDAVRNIIQENVGDIVGNAIENVNQKNLREVVTNEIQTVLQQEPSVAFLNTLTKDIQTMKDDILAATQREVRDGVRILVATIRTEVVGSSNDVRIKGGMVSRNVRQKRRAPAAQRDHPISRRPFDMMDVDKDAYKVVSGHRIEHPLQHLLGEPAENKDGFSEGLSNPDENYDEDHEEAGLHTDPHIGEADMDDLYGGGGGGDGHSVSGRVFSRTSSNRHDNKNGNEYGNGSPARVADDGLPFKSRRKFGL
ncbi:hypothetical protein F5876DRAFT_77728 [Lentinula aff. lateritia]|uniref:Uncharacterized protein n=1 Tax=Lentinula aff. lateritia TaxID=2804960 RepID=A0ACC1TXN3_9AGAR|nr:hypothetical protein F5876DRAFT_77728 [Lentinula aff. lateritia]